MAEQLRVIPDALSNLGNELASHGESLAALQRACHDQAEGARPGWVGASAGALSGLLEGWATASAAHIRRFDEHSRGMHRASAEFAEMEHGNAAALTQVGHAGGGIRASA